MVTFMKTALMLVSLAVLAAVVTPAQARPRVAQCVVTGRDTDPWRGPCLFTAERDGSFSVSPTRGRTFSDGVQMISVYVVSRGVGEVRGLTTEGVNSMWGRSLRSPRDPACWIGDDFSVCVY
jgi:hypothetical protein